LELGDHSGEIQSASQMLNSIRKEFPNCSLIGKNNMGEEEANFIIDQLNRVPDLQINFFINCLRYGISWHHAGNKPKMRQATEMMFRQKFVQMVYATTTLAQAQYILGQ
jgi:replicative superfamily II helicase